MKAIVQKVVNASVTIDGKVISSINNGLCVLVGIGRKDAPKEAEWLVRKILNLRLFDDDNGKRWNKNVMEKKFEVLCVSQFTLCVQMKGNKPDFHDAMAPDQSEQFYKDFLQKMRTTYAEDKIKDGVFGAMMVVNIANDGPVTIPLESPDNLPEPKVRKWQTNKKTEKEKKGDKEKKDDKPNEVSTFAANIGSGDSPLPSDSGDSSLPSEERKGESETTVTTSIMNDLTLDSGGGSGD